MCAVRWTFGQCLISPLDCLRSDSGGEEQITEVVLMHRHWRVDEYLESTHLSFSYLIAEDEIQMVVFPDGLLLCCSMNMKMMSVCYNTYAAHFS